MPANNNKGLEIRVVQVEDSARYDSIASECGTVFNTVAWTNLFGSSITRYGIYEKSGELIGGFAISKEKKYGCTILRNPPFTPFCGPFLRVRASKTTAITNLWRKTMEAMAEFFERQSFTVLFTSLDKQIQDTLPFYWRKFKIVPSYTYIVDLGQSEEQILGNMASVRRRNIKKGTRDGLVVKRTRDFRIVQDLVLQTYSRQEKKVNQESLDAILFEYANDENCFAFSTYRDDTPIACSFVVHDRNTAYYLLGGYHAKLKHHGAGVMAMTEAIRYAKELKLKYFDFEGSVVPAIERYFRGFGGTLTPYFTVNKAWLPVEIGLKLFKRELF